MTRTRTARGWPAGIVLAMLAAATAGQEVEVGVVRPERRDMTRRLKITGSVQPFEEATIVARVSGCVEAVPADLGDEIAAGEPLLVISAPEILDRKSAAEAEAEGAAAEVRKARELRAVAEAKVAEAEADHVAAVAQAEADVARLEAARVLRELKRVTHERYAALKEKQAATPQQVDEAHAGFRHAEAQERLAEAARITSRAATETAQARIGVARAEVNAADAGTAVREGVERAARAKLAEASTRAGWLTVRAPFAGRVFARHVHRGAFVRGGDSSNPTPLFDFQATGKVRVAFEVPDAEAPHVRPGNGARITGRGIPGDPVEATVTRTAGARAMGTRALPVEVHLDDGRLRPGMFVTVDLGLDTRQGALVLPVAAVLAEKSGPSVLVVREGKVEKIAVKLGVEEPRHVEIVSGLTGEEDVIVRGRELVKPGAAVRIARDAPRPPERLPPGGERR